MVFMAKKKCSMLETIINQQFFVEGNIIISPKPNPPTILLFVAIIVWFYLSTMPSAATIF